MGSEREDLRPSRWKVRERLVDDSRMVRLSIADVVLPDGARFEQYVMRMPRAATVVVVNERDEVLMLRRHRFVVDRWVWELPGGYVEDREDGAATAAREVEEETGWRPLALEPVLAFQPLIGSVDSRNELFVAHGAERAGTAIDVNEAERVAWIPVDALMGLVRSGEIAGSATVIGALWLLGLRRSGVGGGPA